MAAKVLNYFISLNNFIKMFSLDTINLWESYK